ncbi:MULTISPECIES: SGNH/GDSL hydrolase family protein [unclassified Psychrobacter]|uniref:SGNH/GDSL hydrolase family protein n=1 Tax=unclassified Psychrobacter TaxID=196806 RepID=UPI003FD1E3DD
MVASINKKTTGKITAAAKDVLLAPIYLYQGSKVKRDTVRLPEPEGERHGSVSLHSIEDSVLPALNLMLVGDSAAAGVGSQTQADALIGKLIPALQDQSIIQAMFGVLNWAVQATTGHTSFDILRRLYVLPTPSQSVDVMVLSVGVNDTTSNISERKWQQQLEEIIAIAQRKFGVQTLIFSSLPPMAKMPALPMPLNGYVGAKSDKLDRILQQVCDKHSDVHYMAADFARMAKEYGNGKPIDSKAMFASDGFHPSSLTYGYWALQLSDLISELLNDSKT